MKVEVEISGELAHELSYNLQRDDHSATDMIAPRAAELLERYGAHPKLLEQKHEIALAILRDRAMERAVQCAKPGDGSWNIARLADDLLDAVLTGSR